MPAIPAWMTGTSMPRRSQTGVQQVLRPCSGYIGPCARVWGPAGTRGRCARQRWPFGVPLTCTLPRPWMVAIWKTAVFEGARPRAAAPAPPGETPSPGAGARARSGEPVAESVAVGPRGRAADLPVDVGEVEFDGVDRHHQRRGSRGLIGPGATRRRTSNSRDVQFAGRRVARWWRGRSRGRCAAYVVSSRRSAWAAMPAMPSARAVASDSASSARPRSRSRAVARASARPGGCASRPARAAASRVPRARDQRPDAGARVHAQGHLQVRQPRPSATRRRPGRRGRARRGRRSSARRR